MNQEKTTNTETITSPTPYPVTKALLSFALDEDRDIRAFTKEDESIWFLAKDVCEILDIKNPWDAVASLDEDERDNLGITDAIGRKQKMNLVSESGLYALVFKSRKPEAKAFAKWVTTEVLPSIRKTGGYVMDQNLVPHLSQVTDRLTDLEQAVEKMGDNMFKVWNNFGHYSTVSGFVNACCVTGHSRMYTEKAELYKAYEDFCRSIGGLGPEGRAQFAHKIYTGVTGTYSSTRTFDGERIRVIRGIELLPEYEIIIEGLAGRHARKMREELDRRCQFYLGVKPAIN